MIKIINNKIIWHDLENECLMSKIIQYVFIYLFYCVMHFETLLKTDLKCYTDIIYFEVN